MQERALDAAHMANQAAAELTRFVIEGPQDRRPPFGDVQVVELLAASLKQSLDVENGEHDADGHPDDAAMRNQLLGAVTRFLEGMGTVSGLEKLAVLNAMDDPAHRDLLEEVVGRMRAAVPDAQRGPVR
jgi:poly(3-hydroxybutyrate) depolymerase